MASASMSLDGYIANHDNTIGRLFDWLQNGEVEVPTVDDRITFHLSPSSAEHGRAWVEGLGPSCAGARCSTSRTGSRLTQTLRSTSSPTA